MVISWANCEQEEIEDLIGQFESYYNDVEKVKRVWFFILSILDKNSFKIVMG